MARKNSWVAASEHTGDAVGSSTPPPPEPEYDTSFTRRFQKLLAASLVSEGGAFVPMGTVVN